MSGSSAVRAEDGAIAQPPVVALLVPPGVAVPVLPDELDELPGGGGTGGLPDDDPNAGAGQSKIIGAPSVSSVGAKGRRPRSCTP